MNPTPNEPQLTSGATPREVADALKPLVDFAAPPLSLPQLQQLLDERLTPHLMRYDQPTFHSMFNAFPSAAAQVGAQLALSWNQGVTNWQVSPGGAMLEELCCAALCRLFQLGPDADATFMYSGTYANQQALYLALHRHAERRGFDLAQQGLAGFAQHGKGARPVVLASQDAHFSMRHAVRMLGLGEESLLLLPLDAERRIDVAVARTILAELAPQRELLCLVATAGTTVTGAVDPIAPLAELCAAHGGWLHVDGAYGYAYKLAPQWAHLFAGDDLADSITWDPHKQLGAPIPSSLLFVRNWRDFNRMAIHSGYFNRTQASADDVEMPAPNPGLKSPPTTRPLAALPLVTILRGLGLDGVVTELRAHLQAIHNLAQRLAHEPYIELCHRPATGILCFRVTPPNHSPSQLDAVQRQIYEYIMASGRRTISLAQLDARTVLRLVVVSAAVTLDELMETVRIARDFGVYGPAGTVDA
ncbi:MAG: aspartate aminotransferase family protein [Caldilineaceae bacterium]|nr:aspartate aminotransferase family protein [Caldilineaceae bacterium]